MQSNITLFCLASPGNLVRNADEEDVAASQRTFSLPGIFHYLSRWLHLGDRDFVAEINILNRIEKSDSLLHRFLEGFTSGN